MMERQRKARSQQKSKIAKKTLYRHGGNAQFPQQSELTLAICSRTKSMPTETAWVCRTRYTLPRVEGLISSFKKDSISQTHVGVLLLVPSTTRCKASFRTSPRDDLP